MCSPLPPSPPKAQEIYISTHRPFINFPFQETSDTFSLNCLHFTPGQKQKAARQPNSHALLMETLMAHGTEASPWQELHGTLYIAQMISSCPNFIGE